jgi:hypothetical protein
MPTALSRRPIALAAAVASTVGVFSLTASAQTWTGGATPGDSTWGNAGNWSGGTPVPSATTDLFFSGTNGLNPNNNYTAFDDFRNIIFTSGAGAFTLDGNAIDLFGKIENQSTSTQTINFAGIGVNTAFVEINPVSGNIQFNTANLFLNGNQLRVWGNNGNTLTFGTGSIISGTGGSVAINQNSVVQYQSAHTYSGDTFVNAGRLEMLAGSSIANSQIQLGDTSGSAAAEFRLAVTGGGFTFSRPITARSGSTGTKTISSTNTTGTNTLGSVVTLNAAVTISQTGNGGRLVLGTTNQISGSQNVTFNTGAGGTISLTAAQGYGSGSTSTFVSGTGTTEIAIDGALGSASTKLVIQGGRFAPADVNSSRTVSQPVEITGTSLSLGRDPALSAANGYRSLVFSNATATLFNAGAAQTVGVSTSNNRNITFGGGGVRLDNNVTFTSQQAANSRLNFQGGITVTGSRTLEFSGFGQTIGIGGTLAGGGFDLTIQGDSTVSLGGTAAGMTAGTVVAGATSPRVVVNGGTVTSSSANTFAGGVRVTGGTVIVAASSSGDPISSGPYGTGTIDLAGGTFRSDNNNAPRQLRNAFAFTGSFTIGDGGNGGAAVNFLAGGSVSNSPTVTNNSTSGVFVASGGTTLTSGFTLTGAGGATFDGLTLPGDRTITFNGAGTTTLQGPLAGAFTLTLAGSGQNVTLGNLTGTSTAVRVNDANVRVNASNASATFAGGVTLAAGTLRLGNSSTAAPVTAGPVGTGTLTLRGGTVTFTGPGPLSVNNPIVLDGSGATSLTNDNSQSITLGGGLSVAAGSSSTITFDAATYTLGGTGTLAGDLTVGGGSTHSIGTTFSVVGARTITAAHTTGVNFGGGFTGSGSLTFAKDAAAARTVILQGGAASSSYSGTTTVNSGVRLQARGAAGNTLSANSVYNVLAGGTLDVYGNGNLAGGGRPQTIAGLTGAGAVENSNGGGGFGDNVAVLTINTPTNTSSSFDGTIASSNGVQLIKTGAGTQTLNGNANLTLGGNASVTVNGGRLNLNASASGVTVNTGGTLGGNGSVGSLTVAGGTVSPGMSLGKLTASSLSLDASSAVAIEIDGASPGTGSGFYDQLAVSNDATLNGSVSFALLGNYASPQVGDTFYVVNIGGTRTGTFASYAEGASVDLGGVVAQITYNANWNFGTSTGSFTGGNDVALRITAVPEPSAALAMLAGAGLLAGRRRPRRV